MKVYGSLRILLIQSWPIFHIFLDETLQIFTGRGTLVSDIWIDLIGVVIGIGLGKAILERKK